MKLWYASFHRFFSLRALMAFYHLLDILQALPDDLKTKLSLDEDLVSSPKEALSRASAERVAWRNKNLRRYLSIHFIPY